MAALVGILVSLGTVLLGAGLDMEMDDTMRDGRSLIVLGCVVYVFALLVPVMHYVIVPLLHQGAARRERIMASLPGKHRRGTAKQTGKVERILEARYGVGSDFVTVTEVVAAHLVGGRVDLPVTNAVMGADPVPKKRKALDIRFVRDGETVRASFPEHERAILE